MKKITIFCSLILFSFLLFLSCEIVNNINEAEITVTGLDENVNKYLGVFVYDLSKASWEGTYALLSTKKHVLIKSDTVKVRVSHEDISIDPDGVYGINLSIYDSPDSKSTSIWTRRSNKFSSGKTTVSF